MNKETITYKNYNSERNIGGEQLQQQFGERKFLWLMVSILFKERKCKQRWRSVVLIQNLDLKMG